MKKVKNIWEEIHSQRGWAMYPNEELVRHIARRFFKLSKEKRHKIKILEIGCGQGANLWVLAKAGFGSYGIDISESAIKKTREYLTDEYGVGAHLAVANAIKLPFENETFDAIVDCVTIQHLSYEDHKKSYAEVFRTLKPGGFFWSFHIADKSSIYKNKDSKIGYKTFRNLSKDLLADVGVVCMLSDGDIKSLLKKQGFKEINIEKNVRTYENQRKEIVHWDIVALKL